MDKNYLLTIKEFSALTQIKPPSLRYYDSIGVLKPVLVDPETGYRYYAYYQKEEAFIIQMVLNCGIPLKKLTDYYSQDNAIRYEVLTRDMIAVMEQKIQQLQNDIQRTKALTQAFSHANAMLSSNCPVRETLPELQVFCIPFAGKQFSPPWQSAAKEISKIFNAYNMIPVFTGIMAVLENGSYQQYLYASFSGSSESVKYAKNEYYVQEAQQHPCFYRIPGGQYLCCAVPESGMDQVKDWSAGLAPESPELILEMELGSGEYQYFPPKLEQRILINPATEPK